MSREKTAMHGSRRRYADGCRCRQCRLAIRFYARERQARAVAAGPRKNGHHGTSSEYINHACRCGPCTAAHSAKCAEYARRRKEMDA